MTSREEIVSRERHATSRLNLVTSIAASSLVERIDPDSVVTEETLKLPIVGSHKYRIIVTDEMDVYDKPMSPEDRFAAALLAAPIVSDDFAGTKRRNAKLTIVDAPVEVFADLSDLIQTLPSDNTMIQHNPHIKDSWNSKRVTEEIRNIRLHVWLYAAKAEDDRDFHLIFGRAPGLTPKLYMTMELSGLPPSSSTSFARLKTTRDAYKHAFDGKLPGKTYSQYDPPIPIEIEGSLLFDITHAKGGRPGPSKLRDHMPVIWEVHPISSILFEP